MSQLFANIHMHKHSPDITCTHTHTHMLNMHNMHKHIYTRTHTCTHTHTLQQLLAKGGHRTASPTVYAVAQAMTQIFCTLVPRRPGAPPSPHTPSPLRSFHVHFSKRPVADLFTFRCLCDSTCSSSGKEKSEE